ncbi:hypothetical protein FOZ63_005165, partial [Perkinsus olseni]
VMMDIISVSKVFVFLLDREQGLHSNNNAAAAAAGQQQPAYDDNNNNLTIPQQQGGDQWRWQQQQQQPSRSLSTFGFNTFISSSSSSHPKHHHSSLAPSIADRNPTTSADTQALPSIGLSGTGEQLGSSDDTRCRPGGERGDGVVSAWRMLFIGNELNERSTYPRVSSAILWVLVLLFIHTFNWMNNAQWTPEQARIAYHTTTTTQGVTSDGMLIDDTTGIGWIKPFLYGSDVFGLPTGNELHSALLQLFLFCVVFRYTDSPVSGVIVA